jgi:hypothetical protein
MRAGPGGRGSSRRRPRWERVLAWSCGLVMLCVAIVGFEIALHRSIRMAVRAPLPDGVGAAGAYGRLDIPGTGRVRLPSGRVNLYFDAVTGALATPVPELSVGVHPADGRGADPTITNDLGATNLYNGEAVIRLARLEVPHAGEYRVSVSGQVAGYLQPRLLVGHDAPGAASPIRGSAWGSGRIITVTGIVEAAILVVSLLALAIGRRRARERVVMAPPAVHPDAPPVDEQTFEGVQVVNASGGDPAELIEKLARLREQGLITDQQFEAAKQQLDRSGSAA